MDCEQFRRSSRAGSIARSRSAERELLEIHLGECSACRALSEDFGQQDQQLRLAFAARREQVTSLAERIKGQLAARGARKCSLLLG